jgi:hypothetical protein
VLILGFAPSSAGGAAVSALAVKMSTGGPLDEAFLRCCEQLGGSTARESCASGGRTEIASHEVCHGRAHSEGQDAPRLIA